ncbi:site-specific integrase [Thermoanaerobacterium sp. CMT5567-10]|uniref:site-specific integrase n=1 Tax=Thermoanaerobacterium sp. CMT5567-10 TaxID=3061989 RepID=UPI0026E0E43D|nr:site-specific integrase [Thermoanaerobacterium sp. CMT5567-10]WKV08585.1 site-specific integrase [Thermoanaerobacterium sp. CMT5567-10]
MNETKQIISFEKSATEFLLYLRQIPFSQSRINLYERGINQISEFIKQYQATAYSADICNKYIDAILDGRKYDSISRLEKDYIRVATALLQHKTTGAISYRIKRQKYELTGEIGDTIYKFVEYRRKRNFSEDTIAGSLIYLSRFYEHLRRQGVQTISELNQQVLISFVNSLGFYSKATIHCTLCALRVFLRYLYNEHLFGKDLSYLISKDGYRKEAKLPTSYTKEEVEHLLASVDRGNPKGKRDYVMLLLAARLGLRASDICGLKFANIIWDQNLIVLIQQKTKKRIELPILQEVGNAIIDYMKYGRPISDSPFIFLKLYPPYDRLAEPTLHSIVSTYLNKAGIKNISIKKHGLHALRHSLAGILLEKKTPLPVISEVLGHESTESTKSYLRIDMPALRQCALEVPPLNKSFYGTEVSK